MDARRGRPAGLLVGLAALLLLALGFAGCGSSSNTASSSTGGSGAADTAFEAEVRGAMESIGNFVSGHEALKEASQMKRVAQGAIARREAQTAEQELELMEAEIDQAEAKLDEVHFGRFSKKANEEARRRVESKGLVAYGCKETDSGWHC